MNEITQELINHPYINVKELDRNLMSLNFTRKAFFKGHWDNCTIKARGLFCDKTTGNIVARAYNKFFNMGEREETMPSVLEHELAWSVQAFKKENGFLGILSVDKAGNPIFATKSVINSEFVDMFKEAFGTLPLGIRNYLITACRSFNCSITFEVCHVNDKHIIDFDNTYITILDAIPNKYNINGTHIDEAYSWNIMRHIPKEFRKKYVGTFQNMDELQAYIQEHKDDKTMEGIVVQDRNGYMFKVKFDYYTNVKRLRGAMRYVNKHYADNEPINFDRYKNNEFVYAAITHLYNDVPHDEWKDMSVIEVMKIYFA